MVPTFDDVQRAASLLKGIANRTPVFTSRTANALLECQLFFKFEGMQRAGAFKFRGSYNTVASLPPEVRAKGVLTFSSGNHGAALALVSSLFGIPATVVMPHDAPEIKVSAVRGYGAEILFYDRAEENREAMALDLMQRTGATLIHPYDNPNIIAGAGTCGLEFLGEVEGLDMILVPCGGGGLLSGCCLAAGGLAPDCRVYGIEPEAGDDAKRSLESGSIQTIHDPQSIADGARTPYIGKINFKIMKELCAGIETVTDPQIVRAMRFLWERMKVVVEPTGALAAAAAFESKFDLKGKRVGVVLSGGNVDLKKALNLFS